MCKPCSLREPQHIRALTMEVEYPSDDTTPEQLAWIEPFAVRAHPHALKSLFRPAQLPATLSFALPAR